MLQLFFKCLKNEFVHTYMIYLNIFIGSSKKEKLLLLLNFLFSYFILFNERIFPTVPKFLRQYL